MSWLSYLIGRFSAGHLWPVLGGHRGDAGTISQALFAASFARPSPQDGFLFLAELYAGRWAAGHT